MAEIKEHIDKKKETDEFLAYKISRIFTSKIEIKELENFKILLKENQIGLNIGLYLNVNEETSFIKFDIITKFIDKNSNNVFIDHIGSTQFQIKTDRRLIVDDNEIDLPSNIFLELFSLSYTHSRALLATELNPSIYKNEFFIPVLGTDELKIFVEKSKKIRSKK
ncbi:MULTISPECIES: hypothetical protein [Epilithonimonas]|jgi:hypothetical protein|uniref:Preprotein translocase subunit SecB n=1 Tax=Epilithonimonas hominis TaxID=420404 RepID=A0A1H6M663_9FLAO|nr:MULTISPECIES: hypothetical protein [Epilithonimonas]SEH96831.1 hypothetical protein SAMN05421793_17110 [Epilithonimonas hominis]